MLGVCTISQCRTPSNYQHAIGNDNRIFLIVIQILPSALDLLLGFLRILFRTLLCRIVILARRVSELGRLFFGVIGCLSGLLSGGLGVIGGFVFGGFGSFGRLLLGFVGGFGGLLLCLVGGLGGF